MKKRAIKIAVVILAAVLTMCFAGCGEAGKSAYEIWKEYHPESDMTEEEWANSLTGAAGENGTDGKSAYEIWKENGHEGTEAEFLEWLKGAAGEVGPQGETGPQGQDGAGWTFGYGEPKEEGKKGEFYLDRERLDVYRFGDAEWEYVVNLKGKETYDLGTYTFGGEDSVSVKLPDAMEAQKAYEVIITSKEDVSFDVVSLNHFTTVRSKTRDEAAGVTKNVGIVYWSAISWDDAEEGFQIVPYKDETPTEIQVKIREYEAPKFRADGEWHTIPLLAHYSIINMAVDPALRGKRVKVTERSFLFEKEDPQTFSLRFGAYSGGDCLAEQSVSMPKGTLTKRVDVMPDSPEYRNRSLYFDIPSDCEEISLRGYGEDEKVGYSTYYFAQVKIEKIDSLKMKSMNSQTGEGTEENPYLPTELEGDWRINIPADSTVYVQAEIEGYNERYIFTNQAIYSDRGGYHDGLMIFSKDFITDKGTYSPPLGLEVGESVALYPSKGKACFEITNRSNEGIYVELRIERNYNFNALK